MTKRKYPRDEYMRMLACRFEQYAVRLESGEFLQPSILLSLCYFLLDDPLQKRFFLHVFRLAIEEKSGFVIGREVVTEQALWEIYDSCDRYLAHPTRELEDTLREFRDRCVDLQPGWKRVWVHARRRKAYDKLAYLAEELIENVLDIFKFEMGYGIAKLYVFEYVDFRYRLSPFSATRLRCLAQYLRELAQQCDGIVDQ